MSLRTTPPYRADHVGSLLRPPRAARGARRVRRRAPRRRGAARRRGRGDPRRDPHAGGGRAAVGDRRRVPPRVVAHGLHLPARRDHQGAGRAHRAVLQRGREDRVHAGRDPHRRQARRLAHDLRRRLRVRARRGDDGDAEADDPVAEHGPLPRRPRVDRSRAVSRSRLVLGRSDRRLRRGGAPARRARLHVPAVRRHEPRVPERSAPARLRRVDRRRPRPAARRVHPPHQRGARRTARRAWR